MEQYSSVKMKGDTGHIEGIVYRLYGIYSLYNIYIQNTNIVWHSMVSKESTDFT